MQKTISAVRESIMSEMTVIMKPMVDIAVAEANASLNVQMLLKVPENKIHIVRAQLAELYQRVSNIEKFNEIVKTNHIKSEQNID